MTARDLTPTEMAIRVIVAEHLPGMEPHRITSYAEKIHLKTPLPTDDAWERCKTAGDLAALVDEHLQAEAA